MKPRAHDDNMEETGNSCSFRVPTDKSIRASRSYGNGYHKMNGGRNGKKCSGALCDDRMPAILKVRSTKQKSGQLPVWVRNVGYKEATSNTEGGEQDESAINR